MKGTLEELELKTIEPCKIVVVEDKDYNLQLMRTWNGEEFETIALYRVITIGVVDRYVMAESEAGALSQVVCCDPQKHRSDSIAIKLPLLLRGFGAIVFGQSSNCLQEVSQEDDIDEIV